MKKILGWIKSNWLTLLLLIIFAAIIVYCTNNSSYTSDDYPYSLLYRGEKRITNIIEVVKNQISDYRTIAGRVVTNGLGQTMLMIPRWVFAIFNALVLAITVILTLITIESYNKNKKFRPILIVLIIGLFLSMDLTKYLVYWVMGTTNYIWMMPLLILFIYSIQKIGLFKHPIITGLFIGTVSSFHESLLVFFIIYIIGRVILDLVNKKKLNKWYIFYITMIILASLFIFLSPGNQIRNSTWYPTWYEMNLIQKLSTTIPTVSKTMFGLNSYHNLIPIIFAITICISLLQNKNKISKLLALLTTITYIISIVFNNGWLFLILAILLFISESYYHYNNKNINLTITSLSFYAIIYAMIITPEYAAGRPNYFMYWYMIIIIGLIISRIKTKTIKIVINSIIIIYTIIFSVREISIYKRIGDIVDERNQAIIDVRENKKDVLLFKMIPKDILIYQMEPNTPTEKNYWAHKYFCTYYGLNDNIIIKGVN